jgi:hypothetical protein
VAGFWVAQGVRLRSGLRVARGSSSAKLGRPLNAPTQGRILSAAVGGDDDVRFLSRAGARVRNDNSGVFFAVGEVVPFSVLPILGR